MLSTIFHAQSLFDLAFSKRTELPHLHIYRDESIPDMYSTNFTLIHSAPDQKWIQAFIQQELLRTKEQQRGHLKLQLHPSLPFSQELMSWAQELGFETTVLLYMISALDVHHHWPRREGCSVRRGDSQAVAKDAITCLTRYDSVQITPDFAQRKANRKADVYAQSEIIPYVCYIGEEPVGVCDWFVHQEVVRMEEFIILDEWQRKGLGTEMIRIMMQDAEEQGATHMYLTAYAEESAQEMYRKLGFSEVAQELQLLWRNGQEK